MGCRVFSPNSTRSASFLSLEPLTTGNRMYYSRARWVRARDRMLEFSPRRPVNCNKQSTRIRSGLRHVYLCVSVCTNLIRLHHRFKRSDICLFRHTSRTNHNEIDFLHARFVSVALVLFASQSIASSLRQRRIFTSS